MESSSGSFFVPSWSSTRHYRKRVCFRWLLHCARIFYAEMPTDAQTNLKTRKILFISLLAMACAALIYSVLQRDKPWIVPEEGKRRQNPLTASESTLRAAKAIYMDECAQCHGEHGKGDGPEAAMHDPAPSDITDRNHMSTVTDGEI